MTQPTPTILAPDPASPPAPAPAAAPAPAPAPAPVRRSWPRRVVRVIGLALLYFVLIAMTLWATLAIDLGDLSVRRPRHFAAGTFAVCAVAVLIFVRPRRYKLAAFLALFVCVL